jgi:hypothetical protein
MVIGKAIGFDGAEGAGADVQGDEGGSDTPLLERLQKYFTSTSISLRAVRSLLSGKGDS